MLQPRGATRVWMPTPLAVAPYQKTMGDTYHPGDGTAVMIETNANEPDILGCSWDEGVDPVLTLVSRVATTDHAANLDDADRPSAAGSVRVLALSEADQAHSNRRHRPDDGGRDHEGRRHRPRAGARHLRLDRRQHVPRSEGAGCGVGDIQLHARVGEPRRQVRRPERAVRRPLPRRGHSRARRLRPPRRALGTGCAAWDCRRPTRRGRSTAGRRCT